MKLRWSQISSTRIGRILPLVVLLAGLLAMVPGQALADGGYYGHGHGNGNGHGQGHGKHYRAYPSHSYVVVPQHLYVEDRAYFSPYYTGRAYYAPHHHYHAAYRFPVYLNGGVVYRPYSYCGEQVFLSAPVVAPLPRLAFSFSYGTPAPYYYPAPVPYYAPGFSGSFVYVHH